MMSKGSNGNVSTSALRCVLVVLCLLIVYVAPDKYCPPITLGGGSPIYPQRTKGGNVTMYRVFNTEGNLLQLNFTWVRVPSNLSNSNGRYYINKTLSTNSVIASITLWNLMVDPDVGSYTVTACSNCTCNQTTFYLELFHCNPDALPQPVVKYTERKVKAKPSPSGVLYLYALFNGSTNTFLYTPNWVHNGNDLCFGGTKNDGATPFSCNRTMLGNCMFTANLYIYGYTKKDSGNYTVQIIGSTGASRNATIHVDIIDLPEIENCTSGPLETDHNGRAQFVCQVSYYVSKYDDVVVIEDDRKQYNSSTDNVIFGCSTNSRNSSLSTCTVNISTSLSSGSLKYKLCVVYNTSVSSMQCSKDITINITENNSDMWSPLRLGLVIGGGTLMISVVLLLLLVGALVKYRVHRKGKSLPEHDPSETRPLLTPGNSLHSSLGTGRSPGCSPISSVTKQESRMWQTVSPNVLEEDDLMKIVQVVGHKWPLLAQHLGLTKSAISTIKHNYSSDYKQQTYQMLTKWFSKQQEQEEIFRTKQFIVRVIEEKMRDPALAKFIVNILS